MAKILVVDDDIELGEALADHLGVQGQTVEVCCSGEDALQLLGSFHYELIILDWSLPGMSGEEVCKKFRQQGGQTPIIFLTGRGDIHFLESGLGAGADDYLSKPFDIRELTARVKSLLKRRTGAFSPELQIADLHLDVEARSITVGTTVVALRSKEISLLEFLMRNTNRVYSAQQLLEAVWPADAEVTTGSVRTWMNLLRQKLAEAGKPDLIETVPRSGYTIRG
jgi:OmpR-family two-component system manganese-sensing response regulator